MAPVWSYFCLVLFQHTATRRWLMALVGKKRSFAVSTHSHPKVAGQSPRHQLQHEPVSTHSHPKVAGNVTVGYFGNHNVSTHSHPKVADLRPPHRGWRRSFNTQPPEGGCRHGLVGRINRVFQHTATRRWLLGCPLFAFFRLVSTHSHPKVAVRISSRSNISRMFQYTATRRWLCGT